MICIPVISRDMVSAIKDIKKANKIADIIELRIDFVSDLDLKKLIDAAEKPIIVTNRRKSENGNFKGTEGERLSLLKKAIELGADYVDIEINADYKQIIKNKKKSKIIVSYHNFKETPTNLDEVYNNLISAKADIIKIATKANKLSDNLKILELIKKSDKPIITICMGELGEISRILAPLYGSFLTFASLEKGKESAQGQIPAETLRNIYRVNDIKPGFKIYGIIGNPVSESKGYLIHNPLFKQYKINSIYLNFLADDLEDFIKNFSDMMSGFSITMPYKEEIINYLDKIDAIAEKICAVNTVVKKDGKLIGHNTDMTGAIKAIENKTSIKNKNITIIGAGGAARAIAFGLIKKGAKLTILNRTVKKAEKLAKELSCNFGQLSNFKMSEIATRNLLASARSKRAISEHAQKPLVFDNIKTDILINTTSVGMRPYTEKMPINAKLVKNIIVFDAIYNPEKTKLLKEAEKNNCTIISGKEMFINQAAEQFRLWTGIQPDINFIRSMLK